DDQPPHAPHRGEEERLGLLDRRHGPRRRGSHHRRLPRLFSERSAARHRDLRPGPRRHREPPDSLLRKSRMRNIPSALMVLSCGLAAWAGCSPKKQTEIIPGVSTQVRVPKDMKSVRLDVTVNGQNRFCNVYDVTNGVAHLPRTLGLQSGGANGPVKITV